MVLLNNPCRVSMNKSENFCPQDLSIGQSITSTLFIRNASIALEAMEEMRLDKPELDSTMRNLVMGANGSYFEMWGSLNPGDDGRSDDEEGEGCEENDEDTVGVEELCDGERTTEENDGGTDEDVEGDQALHSLSASSVLTSLVVNRSCYQQSLNRPPAL